MIAIERTIWEKYFEESTMPAWRCSTCSCGTLRLQQDSFRYDQTADTKKYVGEIWFETEMIQLRFSALLICSNDHCGESYALSGTGKVDDDHDYSGRTGYSETFLATHFVPGPLVVAIPPDCPQKIKDKIIASFGCFVGDPDSAANQVRSAVEQILDHKKVAKTEIVKGQRRPLSLHKRIEKFKATNPELADNLLAIKWIGNSGSHSDGLNTDDLLDSFEILEHVIEVLFGCKADRAKHLSKRINRSKGKKPKKRKMKDDFGF